MAAPTKTVGGVLLPESATAGKVRGRETAGVDWGGRPPAPPRHRTRHSPPFSFVFTLQLAEGKVLAVGPGRRAGANADLVPPSVKAGDTVLLPEYGGQQLKLEGKE